MTVEKASNIEKIVDNTLPKFEGIKVNEVGQLIFPFNNDNKKDYSNIMKSINGSGIKVMLLGDDGKAYSPEKMNGRNYSEIRVWHNPIDMYGSGNGTYAKNLEKYRTIVESILDLSK